MQKNDLFDALSKMDKTSEEFFEVYMRVAEKYWDIENPDSVARCRKMLHMLANSSEDLDWMAEVGMMVINNLFKMVEEKTPALHGSFGVGGKEYHFDFYTDKSALTNLEKMLRNTVIQTGKENENQNSKNPVDA